MTNLKADRRREAAEHLWLPYSPPGLQGIDAEPIRLLSRGEGSRVWDIDGNEYIDGVAAHEAMILGHSASEVIDAMHAQAQDLAFLDGFRFSFPAQAALAAELAAVSPGMQYVFFTPGGAEADEVALKLARQYHHLRGEPYRKKVITRYGAFHGATIGAMEFDGRYFGYRNLVYEAGPIGSGVAAAPACESCDFGRASRHLACVHKFEDAILAEGPETVAAIIVDPAATSAAVSIPPDSYLRDLRTLCDRYGVLLIVDEVITGMGRTGRLFCTEYSGIVPDFITMSKALSSGYAPIAATLIAGHVADTFAEAHDTFRHGHTYGGHPLAVAASRAVLKIVLEQRLWERAERLGSRLLDGLRSLSDHRIFWDARGRGMLVGLEIVHDQSTGEDFDRPVDAGNRLRRLCRERGLLSLILHPGNILFLAPPLTMTEDDVDRIVAIVGDAMTALERGD